MLTRHVTGEGVRQLYQRWWIALIVAVALFGVLIVPTVVNYEWSTVAPAAAGQQPPPLSSSVEIGTAFMREYLLPFEIASVLLLVALVGAIVIAFEERSGRRRVLTLAEEVELRRRRAEVPAGAPSAAAADAQATKATS
jgi:NADH-quinone oxidoreductase subunit J